MDRGQRYKQKRRSLKRARLIVYQVSDTSKRRPPETTEEDRRSLEKSGDSWRRVWRPPGELPGETGRDQERPGARVARVDNLLRVWGIAIKSRLEDLNSSKSTLLDPTRLGSSRKQLDGTRQSSTDSTRQDQTRPLSSSLFATGNLDEIHLYKNPLFSSTH